MPITRTSVPVDGLQLDGAIAVNFDEGSLIVRNEKKEIYRLVWQRQKGGAEAVSRLRSLPPGKYTLTNYQLTTRDKDGIDWLICASAHSVVKFDVTAGKQALIQVDPAIRMDFLAASKKDKSLGFKLEFTGHNKAGISIFRDGQRVPVSFLIADAAGNRLGGGPFEFT